MSENLIQRKFKYSSLLGCLQQMQHFLGLKKTCFNCPLFDLTNWYDGKFTIVVTSPSETISLYFNHATVGGLSQDALVLHCHRIVYILGCKHTLEERGFLH